MAKLEEIAELLVNEINSFEKGVAKLEELDKNLSNLTVNLNLKEFQALKNEISNELNSNKQIQEKFNNRFESIIKKAKVYPNWAVITFICALILGLGSIFYSYNRYKNFEKKELKAYNQGFADYESHIDSFFNNNPKSKEKYIRWQNKKLYSK